MNVYESNLRVKAWLRRKRHFLRLTLFSFSAQTNCQWECMGHIYDSIKICIFQTVRRLDTTWNFVRSITSVIPTLFVYTEFTKRKVFEQLTLAVASSSSRCTGGSTRPGRVYVVHLSYVHVSVLLVVSSPTRDIQGSEEHHEQHSGPRQNREFLCLSCVTIKWL